MTTLTPGGSALSTSALDILLSKRSPSENVMYIVYDFNYMRFWKCQNYRNGKISVFFRDYR